MRYSLVTEEGNRIAEGETDGLHEFLSGRKGNVMVRMANQSIFADMLKVIYLFSYLLQF